MKLIQQPKYSSLCGQCCVAMITRVPLSKIISIMGTDGATNTKDVVKALHQLGYATETDRLVRKKANESFPKLCMVHTLFLYRKDYKKRIGGHWVVIKNGKIYDPSFENINPSYSKTAKVRFVSYISINV